MSEAPLQSIVVVGGGTAGWLSAAALAATLAPQRVRITLIDIRAEADSGAIGATASTLAEARDLHQRIGLKDAVLLRLAQATFKLGTKLDGWRGDGQEAFLPHGPIGEGPSFHQYWLRASEDGAFSDYSVAAAAARQMKFAPQVGGAPPLQFGLHLSVAGYVSALQAAGAAQGVKHLQGTMREARRDAGGLIEAVVLEDGRSVEGDFFVDCTGAASLLLGEALGVRFEDWDDALPCSRALIGAAEQTGAIAPFTLARALSAGWLRTIPLQGSVEHAYFYCDRFLSEDEAARNLGAVCRKAATRSVRFRCGVRQDRWRANCVAIGGAAAVLEPLHGVDMHLAQRGVARLISMLPRKGCAGGEREEYNRLMRNEVERMRDFLHMHYAGADRAEPFWRERRAVPLSEELARKRDLFASRGRIPPCDEETFAEADWAALFLAMGVVPERLDVRARAADPVAIRNGLGRMRERIAQAVAAMPTHRDYIAAVLAKAEARA